MNRSIFASNLNQDRKYEHLLIELETSDSSTVALVLRLPPDFPRWRIQILIKTIAETELFKKLLLIN